VREIRMTDFREVAGKIVPRLKISKLHVSYSTILVILNAEHPWRTIVAYTLLHGSQRSLIGQSVSAPQRGYR
jgi:hypothetical protein